MVLSLRIFYKNISASGLDAPVKKTIFNTGLSPFSFKLQIGVSVRSTRMTWSPFSRKHNQKNRRIRLFPGVALMMIKKRSGRRGIMLLAAMSVCLLWMDKAKAWQQEYIVDDQQSNTTERYTWDNDHQPDYNDILAERISSAQNVPGLAVNLPDSTPLDAISSMSLGWNIALRENVTTGPVAAWHYDGSSYSVYNEFGDSVVNQGLDPLWHASVSSLGWRVDSRFGDLRPWAQISYNQQFGDNLWKSQSGLNRMSAFDQEGNWLDVTVGADMLLNQHLAAYAALSQAENTNVGANYLYTMGVSARF
jgi:uncharacterized protein YhjY with autotransporter beta-barrel domain